MSNNNYDITENAIKLASHKNVIGFITQKNINMKGYLTLHQVLVLKPKRLKTKITKISLQLERRPTRYYNYR